ncbi:PQQ-binding-like beta-propeller repeat protein [Nocardia sp. PE-7]|uniref:outer membrane protein assembly factor BamB family protein n=1 Tax=Nocardia sp. PE-7 TaxID=3058426 RepID=UPI002657CD2E|nr:PQQ-binding-like beta-propeller repeat protein [Nocardia sp. PE-7]WKG12428.1 PQQ-binding-like beta-propeller repeat protein [Nocardia sp. PE-7]
MAFSGGAGGPDRPGQIQGLARQLLDPAVPVIPIRPLTLVDIVVGSARAVARHWKVSIGFTLGALVGTVAIVMFASYVLIQLMMSALGGSGDSLTSLMVGFGGMVLVVLGLVFAIGIPCDAAINGVATVSADRAIRGAPVEFAEVFASARQRFWPLCRLMIAFYLMLVVPGWVVPTLALLAGGLPAMLVSMPIVLATEFVLGILFSLAPVVLVLEDKGVASSLKRSAALAKPSFWRLLGLHLAWLVMVVVVLMMTYCPLGLVLGVLGQTTLAFPLYLLLYLSVAVPLFRTAQTLIYTDLLIREGTYGQDLIRELTANATSPTSAHSAPALDSAATIGEPVFDVKPFHVARVAAVAALMLAIVDLPGIPWFIIAAACAVGEWHTRTKEVPWPPQIHDILAPLRLASNRSSPNSAATVSVWSPPPASTVSLAEQPIATAAPHLPTVSPADKPGPDAATAESRVVAVDLTKPSTTTDISVEPTSRPLLAQVPLPHSDLPAVSLLEDVSANTSSPADRPQAVTIAEQPYPLPTPPMAGAASLDRRNLLALLTLGVVVLLAAAGGITWWSTHQSPPSEPAAVQSDGQLRYTFPRAPSITWTLDASQVFDRAQFAVPTPSPTGMPKPGFLDLGDTLITTAYLPNSDYDPDLVAIDAVSGQLRWTATVGFGASCANRTIEGLLPCFGRTGKGPDYFEGVAFFRMSDGSLDHRLAAAKISRIAVIGDDIVTAGYDRIARGTSEDLTAVWSVDRRSAQRCPGSGDQQYFGATADFVYFGNDTGSVVVRATDGKQVIASDAIAIAIYPGHGLVAVTCPGGSTTERSTVVLDSNGTVLRTHEGQGGYAAPLVVADRPGSYVVDGTAYNFTDGKRSWSGVAGVTDIIDDTVVSVGEETLSAVDFRTGETRWRQPFEVVRSYTVPFQWLTDREHVLFTKDGALQAVDLGTGATAWSIPDIDTNPQRAGNGLATTDRDHITFYGPTGAPATGAAPSAAAADPGHPVTRCGKTPQLTPVQYRTDTDGLIVRMELRATCPSGDIISTDALRVSITRADQSVAAGVFDFSRSPLYLPSTESDVTVVYHEFKFPFGTFWRLPNSLGPGRDPSVQQIADVQNQMVACVDAGTSRGPREGHSRTGPVGTSVAAAGVSGPDQERFALDALRAQADADRPSVQRSLTDRWLPQLSSKQMGLVAPDTDGRLLTWSASEILNQHLRLRVKYPEVRLLWSDEWRTFDLRGWWITIAGATFTDSVGANNWCDARNIATDECFAKLISNSRDSKGTTRYRTR